ncbi:hypothetical protein BgiMline_032115, partial [Biomphalaria glabrata]
SPSQFNTLTAPRWRNRTSGKRDQSVGFEPTTSQYHPRMRPTLLAKGAVLGKRQAYN